MNTYTKNMSPEKNNLRAIEYHCLSAIFAIMLILGQFFKSFDDSFWIYMIIFIPYFSPKFILNSEEEKKRIEKTSGIISIIATIASIAFYAVYKGIWIFNAHSWYFFIGTAVAAFDISMIILFIRSTRK